MGSYAPTIENVSFGNVVVQRDQALGSVVATKTLSTVGSRPSFIQCDAGGYQSQWAAGTGAFAPVSYGGQTLYQSGVPGLAFRIVTPGAGSTAGRYGTGALPRTLTGVACVSSSSWWRLCGGTWGNVRLDLVKIASVTGSGPLQNGSLVRALVPGDLDVLDVALAAGSVQTVACSVTNTNIVVPMGQAKNTDFSGVGSTSGDADFSIALNCDAATRVNITLAAGSAGAADSAQGILNLNSGSGDTAGGVGVQVLYNSSPVALGTRFFTSTTAADGPSSLPFKARYYQTQAKVTPGKADATATFTMTYQ